MTVLSNFMFQFCLHSMSFRNRDVQNEEDDDVCIHYGTAFPVLEEDETPVRKPIPIHEQIVTDERGKQRFHGAFTGGFSAGFWNTVGSKEGFEPSSFQSSRANRQSSKKATAEDFMDAEDVNEFGIAPKRLKVNEEFLASSENSSSKSLDILERHIRPNPVDLGIRLLRRLGVRDGKGVGTFVERNLTMCDDPSSKDLESEPMVGKVYTCARPPPEYALMLEPDSIEPEIMRKFKLAPEDVATFIVSEHKTDRKGLGYMGINPGSFMGSKSGPVSHSVTGMSGQAFGVGAFEEDDDDIYARENMNDYDFELGPSRLIDKRDANAIGLGVSEGFVLAEKSFHNVKIRPPSLPKAYKPSVPPSVLDSWRRITEPANEISKPLVFVGVKSENHVTIKSSQESKSSLVSKNGTIESKASVCHSNEKVAPSSKRLEWDSGDAQDKTFKPSVLPTTSRFVSAGKLDTLSNRVESLERPESQREKAARLKMFGKLTRSITPYKFASIVCKRFNVKLTIDNSYDPEKLDNKQVFTAFPRRSFETTYLENNTEKTAFNQRSITKASFLEHLNFEQPKLPVVASFHDSTASNDRSRQPEILKQETVIDDNLGQPEKPDLKADESQVLDSLKNFNLLSDVFGDEEEEEEAVTTNEEAVNNGAFRLSSSVSAETESNSDFDSFSKFFKVPEAQFEASYDAKQTAKIDDNVNGVVEVLDEESDDDYGPALPPSLHSNPNVADTTSSRAKSDGPEKQNSIAGVELSFVKMVSESIKEKKKSKKKKHRKSKKSLDSD